MGVYRLLEDQTTLNLSLSHFFVFISNRLNWTTYRLGFVVSDVSPSVERGSLFLYRHRFLGVTCQTQVQLSRWNPMNGECVFILKKSFVFSKLSCVFNIRSSRDSQSKLEIKFGYQLKMPFSYLSFVHRSIEDSFVCFFNDLVYSVSSKIKNVSSTGNKSFSDKCLLNSSSM